MQIRNDSGRNSNDSAVEPISSALSERGSSEFSESERGSSVFLEEPERGSSEFSESERGSSDWASKRRARERGSSEYDAVEGVTTDFDLIADVSLQFECEWMPERVFSIEEAIASVPERESLRRELFERLLEIDLTRGFEEGASISKEEYIWRFPRWKDVVEATTLRIARDCRGRAKSRIGKWVGDYRIDEAIGRGGNGFVYKAFDRSFQRCVAIKFLQTGDSNNEERLRLFRREIVAMGQIPPGSIFAQAYACGEDDGDAYLAMEFVDGVDLYRYFKNENGTRPCDGPLGWREATDYVAQIASGLITIHELGLAHRDVKPANAMLDSKGKIRVLDLGLAGFYGATRDSLTSATQRRTIAGTSAYLAPEARNGLDSVDARSDLYCLGGTYLYLLTGVVPSEWFDPIEECAPEPLPDFLRDLGVRLPSNVVAVLARLLEPDREKRYQTARDAYKDLNALLKPSRFKRRAVAFAAISLVAFAAISLGAFAASKLPKPVPKPDEPVPETSEPRVPETSEPPVPEPSEPRVPETPEPSVPETPEPSEPETPDARVLETLETRKLEIENLTRKGEEYSLEAFRSENFRDNQDKFYDNQGKATDCLEKARDAASNLSKDAEDLLNKRADWDDKTRDKIRNAAAAGYYWDARASRGLKREWDDVKAAIDLLGKCLELDPNFPDANKLRGDFELDAYRSTNDAESKRRYAEDAAEDYRKAAERPNATDDERRYALGKRIETLDVLGDRARESIADCDALLKIAPDSKFARRRRGKIRLFDALAASPDDLGEKERAEILDDLRAATDEKFLEGTSEEKEVAEIWIENAVAELKFGDGSRETLQRVVDEIGRALEANPKQKVYCLNGVAWSAFGIRRDAFENLSALSDSREERIELDRKIREDALAERESSIENAVAELKFGDGSRETLQRVVDEIDRALETDEERAFYAVGGVEWNAFELRRLAREKLRALSDSREERIELDRKIREDAQNQFEFERDKKKETDASATADSEDGDE